MDNETILFDIKPVHTAYQVRKWTKKYIEYCNQVYRERGDYTGEYCCGFHWCCDECRHTLCNGCADCVHTIKRIGKELQINIDYNDFNFDKLECRIYEAYERRNNGKPTRANEPV